MNVEIKEPKKGGFKPFNIVLRIERPIEAVMVMKAFTHNNLSGMEYEEWEKIKMALDAQGIAYGDLWNKAEAYIKGEGD